MWLCSDRMSKAIEVLWYSWEKLKWICNKKERFQPQREQPSIWRWVVRRVSLTESSRLCGNRRNGGSMGSRTGGGWRVDGGRTGGGWGLDGHPPSGDIWWKPANKCPHHRLLRQKGQGILGTESAQKMIQTRQNWEKWRKVPIFLPLLDPTSSPVTRVPIWLNPSAAIL